MVFNLTPANDPLDGESWAVFQPWADGHGYVFAFRQSGPAASLSVMLHGVEPQVDYALTDVRTGAALGQASGAQLAAGFTVALAAPWTAEVIAVSPAGGGAAAPGTAGSAR